MTSLKKEEKILNKEFESMNLEPKVYHFFDVYPFSNITIASVNNKLKYSDFEFKIRKCVNQVIKSRFDRATNALTALIGSNIPGVAICDMRDNYNRRLGRVIAKGRLLKFLKTKNGY